MSMMNGDGGEGDKDASVTLALALDPGCASPEVKVEARLRVARDDDEAQSFQSQEHAIIGLPYSELGSSYEHCNDFKEMRVQWWF